MHPGPRPHISKQEVSKQTEFNPKNAYISLHNQIDNFMLEKTEYNTSFAISKDFDVIFKLYLEEVFITKAVNSLQVRKHCCSPPNAQTRSICSEPISYTAPDGGRDLSLICKVFL